MKYLSIIFILMFSFSSPESAIACSCFRYPSVCQAYSGADAVIIGKVKEVKSATKPTEDDYYQKITAEVIKSFKGTNETQITLITEGTSCDWHFSPSNKDETFLFYLHFLKQKNAYIVQGGCGRSESLDTADDQLSWLNGLPKSLNRTRFSGTIRHKGRNPEVKINDDLAGIKVKLINDKSSFEALIDKSGMYEIWDIPAGKYKIHPEFPLNYKVKNSLPYGDFWISKIPESELLSTEYSFEIKPNGCGEIDYILHEKIK